MIAFPPPDAPSPSGPVKPTVLAIVGDRYHDPAVLGDGLSALAGTFALRMVERARDVPWEILRDCAAVLVSKGGYEFGEPGVDDWLGGRAEELAGYVAAGGGLLLLHSGVAGFDANPAMLRLARASFLRHPPGLVRVCHRRSSDAGEVAFTTDDEQYFLRVLAPLDDVFLESSTKDHGLAPAGWRHGFGAGRVCALTPGHTSETLRHPAFQAILREELSRCAGLAPSMRSKKARRSRNQT